MEGLEDRLRAFMAEGPYAVVGASADRAKYGNKVFRAYLMKGLEVYAVNPKGGDIEGHPSYPDLPSLPAPVRGISVITPPPVTLRVVEAAAEVGVKYVWMQPGAESPEAVRRAEELGLEVIAGGACFLVVSGWTEAREA